MHCGLANEPNNFLLWTDFYFPNKCITKRLLGAFAWLQWMHFWNTKKVFIVTIIFPLEIWKYQNVPRNTFAFENSQICTLNISLHNYFFALILYFRSLVLKSHNSIHLHIDLYVIDCVLTTFYLNLISYTQWCQWSWSCILMGYCICFCNHVIFIEHFNGLFVVFRVMC